MYIITTDCKLNFNSDSGLNRDNRFYYKDVLVQKLILLETENLNELEEFRKNLPEGRYTLTNVYSSREFEVKFIKQVDYI